MLESRGTERLGEQRAFSQDGWVTKEIERKMEGMSHTGTSSGQLHCTLASSTKEKFAEETVPAISYERAEFSLVVCFPFIFWFFMLFQAKIFQMPLPYSYFIHILGIL